MNNTNKDNPTFKTELMNTQFSIRKKNQNEYEKDLKGGFKLVCLLDSCDCVFPRIEDANGNTIIISCNKQQEARYKKISEISVFKEFLSFVENGQFDI